MDESDLEDILGNYTYYYACEYKDAKTGNMTDGLYYNETHCGADELFPGYPDPGLYIVKYKIQGVPLEKSLYTDLGRLICYFHFVTHIP